jgi:TRAP transporter TAXI family solute receptor
MMKLQNGTKPTHLLPSLPPRVCLALALLAGLTLGLSGCNSSGDSAGGGGNSSGGKQFITVGTATQGGVYSLVGNAIANTVEAEKGGLNWSVTAQGSKGTQENIRKLSAGEIEFGMSNAAIAYFASRGEGSWDKKQEIRSVATLAPNICVFVTTEKANIKTMADLKGKRVVLGPPGAGFEAFLGPILKAHGLTYDDVEVKNAGFLAASELLADGGADAAFMGGVPPNGVVKGLCQSQDVVFVKMNDNLYDTLKDLPFYAPATVKAGVYSDLAEDLGTVNCGNMQLITHADVDEEVVYNFTKLLFENAKKIADQHPAGNAIKPGNVVKQVGVPFHPGAIKYYKEKGFWPEDAE